MADCNVKCPFCGTEYEMDVNLIGQEFECQNCKENFYAEPDVPVEEMQQKESYFNVSCPHCGGMCEIDQNSVGQEVACPYCHKVFNVPPVQENSSPDERIASQQPEKRSPSAITRSPKLTIPSLMQSAKKNTAAGFDKLTSKLDALKNSSLMQSAKKHAAAGFGKFSLKIDPLKNSSTEEESEPEPEESPEMKENIAGHRRALAKFFETGDSVNSTEEIKNSVIQWLAWPFFLIKAIILFIFTPSTPKDILSRYKFLQQIDQTKLENLNILERYGKHIDQLVASPQTLFSPAIDYGSTENNDGSKFHYAIYSDQKNFIYSLEEVTKLYTFEDQLFVFKAYWDYTTGELFSESSEAFFFKDITDISTQSSYERIWKTQIKRKEGNKVAKWIFIISFILACITGIIGFSCSVDILCIIFVSSLLTCLISLLIWILSLLPDKITSRVRVKRSETFVITASSGNHIGMTILCDEWIAAKEANITKRSNADQIIQSIRKMIEEKKVAADA